MDFKLLSVVQSDMSAFKRDMQEAFQKGFEDVYGKTEEMILPEKDIDRSLNVPGSIAYKAVVDGEMMGGAVVVIDEKTQHNHLDFLYVKYGAQTKGIEDFSFTLGEGDKVVIIGEEGNGKSTLLKYLYDEELVAGYAQATGQVIKKGIFGYLPQFMPEAEQELTISEYFADADIYENYDMVDSLGLDYDFLLSQQSIRTLSGGEKVKIQLLKLLCQRVS